MPFAASERPALGVSLLKARLQRDGVACDIAYFNLAFAELLGRRDYERMIGELPFRSLHGEWIFAGSAWGTSAALPDSFVEDVLRERWRVGDDDIELAERARGLAAGFLDQCFRSVAWRDYDVVGFSSYTAQNLASLALARLVKAACPKVTVVFGGANWQGIAGLQLHRRLGFVDFACSGEADVSFPQLIQRLAGQEDVPLESIPGLIYRRAGVSVMNSEGAPIADLDSLPVPDYSDFYAARHRLPDVRSALPTLSVEASRGCWWATTGPCTFCGMDSRERQYRAKSPERVIYELRVLSGLWPSAFIQLADTVVPPSFLEEVLAAVAADPLPSRLFFEVRPDLTKDQVALIADLRAQIQPGIESLNDRLLHLMHKGSRTLENIRLLKWCRQFGVKVHWNLLRGLPGETQQDYDEMLGILPSIRFLTAPGCCQTVSVDRYSPYFEHPEHHGIARLHPLAPYRYLYPFSEGVLEDIAYAFEYDCRDDQPLPDVAEMLEHEVAEWGRQSRFGDLSITCELSGSTTLRDKRAGARHRTIELDALESLLYAAAEDIARHGTLMQGARTAFPGIDEQAVDRALGSLVARRLMVRVDDRYLSLALRRGSV